MSRSARKLRIVAEVKDLLEDYPSIESWSLRQIYYRLVAKQLIPNTINEYKKLSKYLVWAREEGIIDETKLEDRGRKVMGYGDIGYSSPEAFMEFRVNRFKDEWKYFSYKQWKDQPEYIEVWVEKEALARLFEQIANKHNIYSCPTRGYPSYSYVKKAVERFTEIDKPITILYFGDFDPTGINIAENLIERFRKYGRDVLEYIEPEDIRLERVALNSDQIRQYDLPPAPAKKTDTRDEKFVETTGSDDVVELDALEPDVLQKMISDSIAEHIDVRAWNETVDKTEKEKKRLRPLFEQAEINFPEE